MNNTLTLFLVCLKYSDGENFYTTERLVVSKAGDAQDACVAARSDATGKPLPAGNDKDGKAKTCTPKSFRVEWCQPVYQSTVAVVNLL